MAPVRRRWARQSSRRCRRRTAARNRRRDAGRRETNPAKMPRFDAVVANPPFSYRWEPSEALGASPQAMGAAIEPTLPAAYSSEKPPSRRGSS
ncbi:hypothetical protein C7D74_31900 [Klebsiella pneumoniae]|nr:hypothetical protein C7D74_31900 [Klebsiella pneumoniae]